MVATASSESPLQAMLPAALTKEGVVDERGKKLYEWLVKEVYKGNVRNLYRDWLKFNNVTCDGNQ